MAGHEIEFRKAVKKAQQEARKRGCNMVLALALGDEIGDWRWYPQDSD